MAVHESLKAGSVAEAQLDVYRGSDNCTDTGAISIKANVSVTMGDTKEEQKRRHKHVINTCMPPGDKHLG